MEQKAIKGMDCLHFIGGKQTASRNNKSFENVNPATEEVLGTVAEGGAAEVELAVEAAHKALAAGWKKTKPSERAAVLRKISDLILQRKDELAMLECLDTGKPLWLATNVDIPRAAGSYQFFANLISTMGTEAYRIEAMFEHAAEEGLRVLGAPATRRLANAVVSRVLQSACPRAGADAGRDPP